MLQIKVVKNFKAETMQRTSIRRGFVIPFMDHSNRVVVVVDDDAAMDHEYIADDFVLAGKEKMATIIKQGNPEFAEKDIKEFFELYEQIYDSYVNNEKNKEEYKASRKDYLVYEQGAVAFDFRPSYSRKNIIYRDSGKGYFLPSQTKAVVESFASIGFDLKIAPPEHNGPGDEFSGGDFSSFYSFY